MQRKCRNFDDHCCYIGDQSPHESGICPFLEENSEDGFRWSCGLRRELGSWDAVIIDPRYLKTVQPIWDRFFENHGEKVSCKTYPGKGRTCGTCGDNG